MRIFWLALLALLSVSPAWAQFDATFNLTTTTRIGGPSSTAPELIFGATISDTEELACASPGGCYLGTLVNYINELRVDVIRDPSGALDIESTLDMNVHSIIGIVDLGTSSDGVTDLYMDTGGRIFVDPTHVEGMLTFNDTTRQIRLGTSTTDFIDLDGKFFAASSIQANAFLRPDTDGGALLGQDTLRWPNLNLQPRSAPTTTVSTSSGHFWLTDSAGPYGASYGCENGGCPSNTLMVFNGTVWRRADGDLVPQTSTDASVTVHPGRAFMGDTSLNAQAVAIFGCTAARNGFRMTIEHYTQGSTNAITITPASGTIDKTGSYTLSNQGDSVDLICFGAATDWVIH